MEHKYIGNDCKLRIKLDTSSQNGRRVGNVRNCDIFIDDHALVIYLDVRTYKTRFQRAFNRTAIKNVEIKYDSSTRCLRLKLPCMPEAIGNLKKPTNSSMPSSQKHIYIIPSLDFWKLKRITPTCRLRIDNSEELLELEANFAYGFASKYDGKLAYNNDFDNILRIPQPHLTSPIQRHIEREIAELKDFSREQYKLNFMKLDVPEGHANPIKYKATVSDTQLSCDQECLLHNIISKEKKVKPLPKDYSQAELENGLVSILCAICYDIRTTGNEPSCQSAWTRSILSSTLVYFEPCERLKDTLIAFVRRSLIYPLYRRYELGIHCINDVAIALRNSPQWILKQLLITHELFASADANREVFNHYFIEDYIRYVNSELDNSNLKVLGYNVNNLIFDINKKLLRMNLREIEAEWWHEVIALQQLPDGDSSDDEFADNYYFETDFDDGEEEDFDDNDNDDDYDDNDDDDEENETEEAPSVGNSSTIEADRSKADDRQRHQGGADNDGEGDDGDDDGDADDDDDDDDDEDDDENCTSDSSSETEENSVIEQTHSQTDGCGKKSLPKDMCTDVNNFNLKK